MGLRDQLLKAGLVSKKQAKQADAASRKHDHDIRKNKEAAVQAEADRKAEIERIESELLEKREQDKQRNLELEAARKEREKLFRCRQLMRSNRLNEHTANIPYFFPEENKFVRKVLVNAFQREMLARGKYAIGRPEEGVDEFFILPSHTADTVVSLRPEMILLKHPPLDDAEELKVE